MPSSEPKPPTNGKFLWLVAFALMLTAALVFVQPSQYDFLPGAVLILLYRGGNFQLPLH